MAKRKRKTLPDNFEALLKEGDMDKLRAVYETCEINARWGGGSFKLTALAHKDCPDELALWLVAQGADMEISDTYGVSPLHARIGWQGDSLDVLLELGADPNVGEGDKGTPLHRAADRYNIEAARKLLAHGARIDALDNDNLTPLAYTLQRCSSRDLERLAPFAAFMIEAGAKRTPNMKTFVARHGKEFELRGDDYEADAVDAVSDAVNILYELFNVPPAPRRTKYDGKSPIIVKADTWQGRHNALWELLVPSSGAAATVQGEVIRISGKIDRELAGNGGANWDKEYKKLAKAFLGYIQMGTPLPKETVKEVRTLVRRMNCHTDDAERLAELAVDWVALNSAPLTII